MKVYGKTTLDQEKQDQQAPLFAAEFVQATRTRITDYFAVTRERSLPGLGAASESQPAPKEPKRLCQTYIDLGQTNFLFKECSKCGMKYDSSFSSDVELHKRFHRFATTGMPIKYGCSQVIGRHGKDYVCITVSPKRSKDIISMVNNELSAVECIGNERVFAAVDGSQLVCSVLVIEPHPQFLRVSRIWTRKDSRKKGIATALIVAALNAEGKSRENVQFSSPTPLGGVFAKAFMKTDEVSIYDQGNNDNNGRQHLLI